MGRKYKLSNMIKERPFLRKVRKRVQKEGVESLIGLTGKLRKRVRIKGM